MAVAVSVGTNVGVAAMVGPDVGRGVDSVVEVFVGNRVADAPSSPPPHAALVARRASTATKSAAHFGMISSWGLPWQLLYYVLDRYQPSKRSRYRPYEGIASAPEDDTLAPCAVS